MFFDKPKTCCVCRKTLKLRCKFYTDDPCAPPGSGELMRRGYFCREHLLENAVPLIEAVQHPFVYFRYPHDRLKEAQLTFYSPPRMNEFDFDEKDCQDLRALLEKARPAEGLPVVLVPYDAVGDATRLPLFKNPNPPVELVSKEDMFRDLAGYLERMELHVSSGEFWLYPPHTDSGGLYCWHNFT